MSKRSYLCIAIMLAALLYMGAVRAHQWYARQKLEWENERQESVGAFSFQQVPVSLAAPQAEPMAEPVLFSTSAAQAVFLEDAPLPAEQQERQAQDTLTSIVRDYNEEPAVQSFNAELSQATRGEATDISALSGAGLEPLLEQYPQVKEIVAKHMKDPTFAQTVDQIFSNPQFIESVRQLQQTKDHKKD